MGNTFFGRTLTMKIMYFICSITCGANYLMIDLEEYKCNTLFFARFGITIVFSCLYTYSREFIQRL